MSGASDQSAFSCPVACMTYGQWNSCMFPIGQFYRGTILLLVNLSHGVNFAIKFFMQLSMLPDLKVRGPSFYCFCKENQESKQFKKNQKKSKKKSKVLIVLILWLIWELCVFMCVSVTFSPIWRFEWKKIK